MKRYFVAVGLMVLTLTTWTQRSWAQLLIDDFSTGKVKINIKMGERTRTQTGSMLGGSRFTHFLVGDPNSYNQFGTFEIKVGGPLIVSSDYKVFHRLEMIYGVETPLNLNLLASNACGASPCGRFRVHFDGNSRVLNFNIVAFTGTASYFQLGFNMNESGNPFTQDFPFVDFVLSGVGATFSDIDRIDFIFQSGSAIGSNDFAITKVEAVP